MSSHQVHFGRKFYQDKKTGYWISCDYGKDNPRIRAHQWVWKNIHKIIPKGYHIHHINDDKSDNTIENLELIKGSRHLSLHMQDPDRKESARNMADKYRHLTKEWHASEEGRHWHRIHAAKNNFGKWDPLDYKCEVCYKDFKSKKISRVRFCSNACKSKFRRDSKVDDEERKCSVCENTFKTNKYTKTLTCGRACHGKIKC
jgi:hypothetical protein